MDSNGERGRVLFLDYDEYATVAMSELLEADETTVAGVLHMRLMGTVLLHRMATIFRPMTERVGGVAGVDLQYIHKSTFVRRSVYLVQPQNRSEALNRPGQKGIRKEGEEIQWQLI